MIDIDLTRDGGSYDGTWVGYVRVHVSTAAVGALASPVDLGAGGCFEAGLLAMAMDEVRALIATGEFVPGGCEPPWDLPVNPAEVRALADSDDPLIYIDDDDPDLLVILEIDDPVYGGAIERYERQTDGDRAVVVLDLRAYGDHYLFAHAHCETSAVGEGERAWRALECVGARLALRRIEAGQDFFPCVDYADVRPDLNAAYQRSLADDPAPNWSWDDAPAAGG